VSWPCLSLVVNSTCWCWFMSRYAPSLSFEFDMNMGGELRGITQSLGAKTYSTGLQYAYDEGRPIDACAREFYDGVA